LCPEAEGFCVPEPETTEDLYAACLQGVALVERLGYAVLDEVIGTGGGEVFSTGGGSRSDVWMQCRANVTGRVVHRPACPESAFGAAVLAAAGSHFGTLAEATRAMVNVERSFQPDSSVRNRYDELFQQFLAEWKRREYL
jgi:sugar (pentulose or hexulose) kinase